MASEDEKSKPDFLREHSAHTLPLGTIPPPVMRAKSEPLSHLATPTDLLDAHTSASVVHGHIYQGVVKIFCVSTRPSYAQPVRNKMRVAAVWLVENLEMVFC